MHSMLVFAPFALNVLLLYHRRRPWARSSARWFGVGLLFIAGCFTFFNSTDPELAEFRLLAWNLLTPLVFSLVDYGVSWLSLRLQGREIYVWLRGSKDIKPWTLSGGSHVSMLDRFFSMLLICVAVGLVYVGAVLFG